jgi:hypothetical protein
LAKGGLIPIKNRDRLCFYESEVPSQIPQDCGMLLMNFNAKNPAHRQAAKRYL